MTIHDVSTTNCLCQIRLLHKKGRVISILLPFLKMASVSDTKNVEITVFMPLTCLFFCARSTTYSFDYHSRSVGESQEGPLIKVLFVSPFSIPWLSTRRFPRLSPSLWTLGRCGVWVTRKTPTKKEGTENMNSDCCHDFIQQGEFLQKATRIWYRRTWLWLISSYILLQQLTKLCIDRENFL